MFYPGKFDLFAQSILFVFSLVWFSILGRYFTDQNVFNRLHKYTLNKDETEFLC